MESRFVSVFAWLDLSGPNYYMEAALVRRLITNELKESAISSNETVYTFFLSKETTIDE